MPKAGKLFGVQMAVARQDTAQRVESGRVVCGATIARKPLKAFLHAFARGVATCRWRIPPETHGKTMRGSIALIYQGAKIERRFSVKIE